MPFLSRLIRDQEGHALLMFAGGLCAFVAASALAVDVAAAYVAKRRLQGVADAAALAAASANDPNAAVQAVIQSYALTDVTVAGLTTGTYSPNPNVAETARFVADSSGGNAATVTLSEPSPLFFGIAFNGTGRIIVTASGTAARTNMAAFSLGSGLVGLQGGVVNALLTALTGSSITLSAVDYNALASTDIDLLSFSNALRTQENLTAGTFSQTLQSQTTLPQIVSAMAAAAPNTSSATALSDLAAQLPATAITPSALINLGPMGLDTQIPSGTSIAVNALSMIDATAMLAGGGHEVTLNLGATIPGIAQTTVTLLVGARMVNSPWIAVQSDNSVVVTTSQVRLQVNSSISAGLISGTPLLDLPIDVSLAQASASLQSISCTGTTAQSVTLAVTPSVGTVAIGAVNANQFFDLDSAVQVSPATILSLPLISVTGQSVIQLGGATAQSVTFNASQIAAQASQTVSTNDLLTTTASSLIGNLQLQANVLGIGISAGPVVSAVGSTLTGVAPALDSLLNSLTSLLGVGVGQATVRIDGVRCGAPVLVG
jgi:uncharacterized membrane protein